MASMVVFVSEAQRQLYKPIAPSSVIYVGVPPPLIPAVFDESVSCTISVASTANESVFTVLCLGIVCPRKNQIQAVEIFKVRVACILYLSLLYYF